MACFYCYQSKCAVVCSRFCLSAAFKFISCSNLRYLPERLRILIVMDASFCSRFSLERLIYSQFIRSRKPVSYIGDRSVVSHLCKDGSLEFFDGHAFRSLVRVKLCLVIRVWSSLMIFACSSLSLMIFSSKITFGEAITS